MVRRSEFPVVITENRGYITDFITMIFYSVYVIGIFSVMIE